MTKDEVLTLARGLGIDLIGITTSERLESRVPESARPSQISEYLPSFLVLARHIPSGVSAAADGSPKQFAAGLVHRVLEESAAELAYALEQRNYLAVVLPSLIMDFKSRDELSNTPAGQGSFYLRLAAVEAGLGTLGLNHMLLTPQFGPRVYLCGMMTNLEVEPDEPLAEELCPGLEGCGRCAAVCPADAIPREARVKAPLSEYRNLDRRACAEHSQPHGVGFFVRYFEKLLQIENVAEAAERIESSDTAHLWFNMTVLRQGAFTGCSRCLQVCPVGEDFERLQTSPYRQTDLPPGLEAQVTDDKVRMARAAEATMAKTE